MGARFLTLERSAEWDSFLGTWQAGERDVYWSAAYHQAFEPSHGRATLFAYESMGHRLAYPFLWQSIESAGAAAVPSGWTDIESVYGFCGPLATTADPAFLAEAWLHFDDWCRQQRVVAEFVRFHPLLRNEGLHASATAVEKVRDHVVLDLSQTEAQLWAGYSKENRNMIRKATRLGVECRVGPLPEQIESLVELYRVTMERNRAAPAYYFSRRHFEALANTPSLVGAAVMRGRVVAVSLFLLGERRIHYHLSGCGEEGLRAAANNLILHSTVLEAKRRGLAVFHLGGGRSGAASDPLLRFKAAFSRQRAAVFVGRRVHNPVAYETLCALRRSQVSVPPGFFLAYRYEPAPLGDTG